MLQITGGFNGKNPKYCHFTPVLARITGGFE
jgi:hypothetical protein